MLTFLRNLTALAAVGVLLTVAGCTIEAVRLNRRAQVYFHHGDYVRSEQLLDESLDIDYENPASHYWLGRCCEVRNRPLKAIYEYGLAVRFAPAMEIAQLAYIAALHKNGQEDKSMEATRSFLANKTAPARGILLIAGRLADLQLDQQAVLAYLRAQQVEPRNPQPSLALADYYFASGKEDQGIESLVKAFMIAPRYPGLARRLGNFGRRVEIPDPPPLFSPRTPFQRQLDLLEQ